MDQRIYAVLDPGRIEDGPGGPFTRGAAAGTIAGEVEAQLAETTRVVLVDMPALLRGIVREVLAPAADLELVGEFPAAAGLAAVVEATGADVVVAGGALAGGDAVARLLETHPHVRVLAIAEDGRRATVFLLAPEREPIGEVSPEVLLEAVRRQADWGVLAGEVEA